MLNVAKQLIKAKDREAEPSSFDDNSKDVAAYKIRNKKLVTKLKQIVEVCTSARVKGIE
jgi:non-homologous end joining protein Ku